MHRVGRAELAGPGELALVEVDADDRAGADEARRGDRRVPDAAAAEHGDGVVSLHAPVFTAAPKPGHDAASEQARRLGSGATVDRRRLPGGDEGVVGERADPERRGQRRAVVEGHRLLGVVGREAVPGTAPTARPALAAHGAPVEDHEVADGDARHVGPDGVDDAGGLVAEQVREVAPDVALAVVQVGVAHPARLDRHDDLAGTGVGHDDVVHADGFARGTGDDAPSTVGHEPRTLVVPALGPGARDRGLEHGAVDATRRPVVAPVQGTVVAIAVEAGDVVRAEQELVVIESMKLEHVGQRRARRRRAGTSRSRSGRS